MFYPIVWFLAASLACASVGAQLITITDALGQTIAETVSIDPIGNQFTSTLSTVFPPTVTTTTVADPAGQSVVEVISSDPIQGEVVTSTISTLPLSTVPVGPVTTAGQGPVGAPTSTAVGVSTTYTYSTTDANGAPLAVVTVFQPTFPSSNVVVSLSSASIMAYSDYTAAVGTNTVVHNRQGGASHIHVLSSAFLAICISIVIGGLFLV